MKHLVFTDIDGYKVYQDERGDLINSHGHLLGLEEEANVRREMGQSVGAIEYGDR